MGVSLMVNHEPANRAPEVFESLRPRLFGVAYRMVGVAMDAEDILQEAYLRWQAADQTAVASPQAFLTTMVTRLAIDHLRSAQVRREEYVGPWLPEPILADHAPEAMDDEADEHVLLLESLSSAFLVLLESLNPVERATFLLHDVFDYDFAEIAPIVGKSEANVRQIARRARAAVSARRPRFEPLPAKRDRLLHQFIQSCEQGDLPGLLNLLAGDIVLSSDGGGKVAAARHPIHGPEKVAALLLGLTRRRAPNSELRAATINGQPGLIYVEAGKVRTVVSLHCSDDHIQAIYAVSNPDKLRYVAEQIEQS
jgi:RNA polymerase sigma-70 factor (ECF subfamily)